jgi:two-component system response regulator AtoC
MAATSLSYSRYPEKSDGHSSLREFAAHIMVVDDEPSVLEYLRTLLQADSYKVTACSSGTEALTRMQQGLRPDLVLIDCFMPEIDGLSTLAKIKAAVPNTRAIMLSCSTDPKQIVEAMRLGARDFLFKPFRKIELDEAIHKALRNHGEPAAECKEQEIELEDNNSFVFASKRMWEIRSQCALVARVDLPVLILGESGTGKEVLAQFIHKSSPRAHRTFMKVNCAAMPADLLESELFGYEQGAFTGATRSKPGKFEVCNHGTILLDEIGEMPPALQAKLLQVLQDGSFSRLGSRSTIKVDVRVIAATNIDIRAAIAQKKFREDLFYRLNGFTMSLPPLRERKEEIPVLMRYFIRKLADKYAREPLAVSDQLLRACMNYSWPGNLRELENFVKRYLVLADEHMMIAELSPNRETGSVVSFGLPTPAAAGLEANTGLKKLVRGLKDEAEMEAISIALGKTGWNRKQAAAELQISYKALLYKIRQYGIEPPNVTPIS